MKGDAGSDGAEADGSQGKGAQRDAMISRIRELPKDLLSVVRAVMRSQLMGKLLLSRMMNKTNK